MTTSFTMSHAIASHRYKRQSMVPFERVEMQSMILHILMRPRMVRYLLSQLSRFEYHQCRAKVKAAINTYHDEVVANAKGLLPVPLPPKCRLHPSTIPALIFQQHEFGRVLLPAFRHDIMKQALRLLCNVRRLKRLIIHTEPYIRDELITQLSYALALMDEQYSSETASIRAAEQARHKALAKTTLNTSLS